MNKLNISPWNFTHSIHSFTSSSFMGSTKVDVGSMIMYAVRLTLIRSYFLVNGHHI